MRLNISEHKTECLIDYTIDDDVNSKKKEYDRYKNLKARSFINRKNQEIPYYKIFHYENRIDIQADYYVGLDWLVPNKKFVYVAPKVNMKLIEIFKRYTDLETPVELYTEQGLTDDSALYSELNYLKMFMDATNHELVSPQIDGLIFIDWDSPGIEIEQKDDILTPLLVVQFLSLVKRIVRKGLRKDYYKVQTNLHNRIKGKIIVSRNVKTNIVKNQVGQTLCEYEEFGTDNIDNRFLKSVFRFVISYVSNNRSLFKNMEEGLQKIITYCAPAFVNISDGVDDHQLKGIKETPFYKEYAEAIKIGRQILRRFAYNISNTSQKGVLCPPFWIDMPRLFELYVYQWLLGVFPGHVRYHFSTYGNELDFLITDPGFPMVIDAKYKLHFQNGVIHDDIRQVAGYARLQKVYTELGVDEDRLIDCVIVYPDVEQIVDTLKSPNDFKRSRINAYRNIYKVGVSLPLI